MLNPLCFVSITLHFEIRNSTVYGGADSVGYSSVTFNGVIQPENADDDFVEQQRQTTANLLGVSIEDVTVITKEAYDAATEEPDDEGEEDWEG